MSVMKEHHTLISLILYYHSSVIGTMIEWMSSDTYSVNTLGDFISRLAVLTAIRESNSL